jgi:hypothetical protein
MGTFGRHGGSLLWVRLGPQRAQPQSPLCPHELTSLARPVTSEKCHCRTHAPQQTASLIDHLVGAGEHQFMTFFRVGRRAVIILTELTIRRRSNELAAFPLAQGLQNGYFVGQ